MRINTIRNTFICLLSLAFLLILPGCSKPDLQNPLSIKQAWIREAPPNSNALAGYLVIHNHKPEPDSLVSVCSPMFSSVELHRSLFKNGVASMQRQKQITIPANDSVELKPGDYHLMMFNPERPLKVGDETEVTLEFSSGDSLTIPITVRKAN